MPVTIRNATRDDLPAILQIERGAPSAGHWSLEQYEARLDGGLLLVAADGAVIAGFLCAVYAAGDWELENIVVAESHRRRGIANALLSELLRNVADRDRVFLEVRESNQPARLLYARLGFRESGRRLKYYQHPVEDAVLYERKAQPGAPFPGQL